MSSNADDANAGYQSAVEATVGTRAPVRRGSFRLANARKPFLGTLDQLSKSECAQLMAEFGSEMKTLEAGFASLAADGPDEFMLRGVTTFEVIDVETNAIVNRGILYGFGQGGIYESESTTCIAWIGQHFPVRNEPTGKAWLADFARAWVLDSEPLGLWTNHIIFDDEDFGEPDDDEDVVSRSLAQSPEVS